MEPRWDYYQKLQELTEGGQIVTASGYAIPIDLAIVHRKGLQLAFNPPETVSWSLVMKSILVDSLRKYKREVKFSPDLAVADLDLENRVVLKTEVDRLIEQWNERRANRKSEPVYDDLDLMEAINYEGGKHPKKDNAIRNRLYRFRQKLRKEKVSE